MDWFLYDNGPRHERVNLRGLCNLISLVPCISKTEFPLGLIKLRIFILDLLIDSIFLIFSLGLPNSLIQYGKNALVLAAIDFILFRVVEQVRCAPSLTSLW